MRQGSRRSAQAHRRGESARRGAGVRGGDIELIHSVDADAEQESELQHRREKIERRIRIQEDARYWLRQVEPVRRERLLARENSRQEYKRTYTNKQRRGSIGSKIRHAETPDRERAEQRAQQIETHQQEVEKCASVLEAVNTPKKGIASLRSQADELRLRFFVGAENPQRTARVTEYLASVQAPLERHRFWRQDLERAGSKKAFVRSYSYLFQRGDLTKEDIGAIYDQLADEDNTNYVDLNWYGKRSFTKEQEKGIDRLGAEAENIIETIHLLSLFGVRVNVYDLIKGESEESQNLLAVCEAVRGHEAALSALAQGVSWRHQESRHRNSATQFLHVLESGQLLGILNDTQAAEEFIAYVDTFVPAPSIGNLEVFVAAFVDPHYTEMVDRVQLHGSQYITDESVLVGLYAAQMHSGVVEVMDRRLQAGFGLPSATQSRLLDIARAFSGDKEYEQKATALREDVLYIVEPILDSTRLVELSSALIEDLDIRVYHRDGIANLLELEGSEQIALAVATAGVAFNPSEPLVADVSQIVKILNSDEQIERILDPEYAHFVRRIESMPGLSVRNSVSTVYDNGDYVPFLYMWYSSPEYRRMLDDTGVQQFFGTAAEMGMNCYVESWLHLEEILHWANQPVGIKLLQQFDRLGDARYAMEILGSGGNRYQLEQYVHGEKADIFMDERFPQFYKWVNGVRGKSYMTGGEMVTTVEQTMKWIYTPRTLDLFMECDADQLRVMHAVIAGAQREGVHLYEDFSALLRVRHEDWTHVNAYMKEIKAGASMAQIDQFIAYAREQESIERGNEWWAAYTGDTVRSQDYIGLASLGKALETGEARPRIKEWMDNSYSMRPGTAAILLRDPDATERFIDLYEAVHEEHSLDTPLHQLSQGSIEGLSEVLPHIDVLEHVVSVVDRGATQLSSLYCLDMRAADLALIGGADDELIQSIWSRMSRQYLSTRDVVSIIATGIRIEGQPEEEKERIWSFAEGTSHMPTNARSLDLFGEPEIIPVLDAVDRLRGVGYKVQPESLYAVKDILDSGLIVDVIALVEEHGYTPNTIHVATRFLENGGLDHYMWFRDRYGFTLDDLVDRGSIRGLQQFRESEVAVAAVDQYAPHATNRNALAYSIMNFTQAWIWAGTHPTAYDAFLGLAQYYASDVDIRLVRDFQYVRSVDEAVAFMEEIQQRFQYQIQPQELFGILRAAKNGIDIVDELAYVETLSPGFAREYFRNHVPYRKIGDTTPAPSPIQRALRSESRLPSIVMNAAMDGANRERSRFVAHTAMSHIRREDPALAEAPELREAQLERADEFIAAIRALHQASEADATHKDLFLGVHALRFVARQPERVGDVVNLAETEPIFFDLIAPGGALATNRDRVLQDIFSNGNVLRRVREMTAVFTKAVPYWRQLSMFTEMRLGPQLARAGSSQQVEAVGGRSIESMVEAHIQAKAADPEATTRLTTVITNSSVRESIVAGERPVMFSDLGGVYKRLLFRERIRETVELSRDDEAKARLDQYNRTHVQAECSFEGVHFSHGTRSRHLGAILYSGNLCGESLGGNSSTDAVPFHVDVWKLEPEHEDEEKRVTTIPEMIEKTKVGKYATGAEAVTLLFDREYEGAVHSGFEVPGVVQGDYHAVLLGGLPSANITGIVVHQPDQALNDVRRSLLEFGAYIPLYDADGKLLYSPDQYDTDFEYMNMGVGVAVWENSMKVGEQMGSNHGGVYMVPGAGAPERHYVKFETDDGLQSWNEHLTNRFYEALGVAVAHTQVVKVDGSYGHASLMVEEGEQDLFAEQLKDGFVADSLLANWDIVFKRNSVSTPDGLVRIDNGGALLFRARGGRRDLTGTVTELESMRRAYPGLTNEDIQLQVDDMLERLTDERIDALVDSVRLPAADRGALKEVLRERRDYIARALNAEALEAVTIPEDGARVAELLRADEINDAQLAQIIPEWSTLVGEAGYQHNGVLLGEHLKDAVAAIHSTPEYAGLSQREQNLASLAMLFHDFGKPTGMRGTDVRRDYRHEIPSANAAAKYMKQWGYSAADIRTVVQIVTYDGVVSDIARGKVRDERLDLSPAQLRELVGGNETTLRILRAVNKADVIATVGAGRFEQIAERYNEYFDELLEESAEQ